MRQGLVLMLVAVLLILRLVKWLGKGLKLIDLETNVIGVHTLDSL